MFKFPLMPGSGEQELRHTGKSKQLSETSSFPESPACWCWLPPPSLPPRCWWLWLYKCYSDTVCLMSLVAMLQPWLVNIRNCPLCVCVHVCVCVCVLICSVMSDSFVTPMDWSPPGSSVHGIVQARTLEWVAVFFSRGPSWPGNGAHVSCTSCIGRQILYHWDTWKLHTNLPKKRGFFRLISPTLHEQIEASYYKTAWATGI